MYLANIILIHQKKRAKTHPVIIVNIASGANTGTKKGTTTEAIEICPRSANIVDTVLVCSEDSMGSIITFLYTNFSIRRKK